MWACSAMPAPTIRPQSSPARCRSRRPIPRRAGVGSPGTQFALGAPGVGGDTFYNLVPFPTNVKYLATVLEGSLTTKKSVHPGHGVFHPVAWCQ